MTPPPVERLLDRLADVAFPEEIGDLAELGHEDVGADLREGVLQAVDELEHEARDVRDRR